MVLLCVTGRVPIELRVTNASVMDSQAPANQRRTDRPCIFSRSG
jgi:hypothetical protein